MTTFRQVKGSIGATACGLTTLLVTSVLFVIIGTVFLYALPSLSFYFVLTPENATPGLGQGIANAITGTLVISFLSTLLAAPLGIGTAIYLQRYAQKNRTTEFLRFLIEVLSGTPSIIMGIFGLLTLVYILKAWTGGFSLLSGTIALSFLIVPVIVRSVENAIEAVPGDLEEGSYALGARKWHTVRNITLPVALPGIVTGLILAFGRAAEESAVVILTAGYSQFIPELAIRENAKFALGYKIYPFQDLVGTLPYSVYHAFLNSNVVPISAGFAAAFVLICIILCINFTARAILAYSTSRTRGSGTGSILSFTAAYSGIHRLFRRPARSADEDSIHAEISPEQARISHDIRPSPVSLPENVVSIPSLTPSERKPSTVPISAQKNPPAPPGVVPYPEQERGDLDRAIEALEKEGFFEDPGEDQSASRQLTPEEDRHIDTAGKESPVPVSAGEPGSATPFRRLWEAPSIKRVVNHLQDPREPEQENTPPERDPAVDQDPVLIPGPEPWVAGAELMHAPGAEQADPDPAIGTLKTEDLFEPLAEDRAAERHDVGSAATPVTTAELPPSPDPDTAGFIADSTPTVPLSEDPGTETPSGTAADESAFVPLSQTRNKPSFIDGFGGTVVCCAGMAGFLGLVYGVRVYTKDLPLDLGSAILIVLIVLIVLGIAGSRYLLRKRRTP